MDDTRFCKLVPMEESPASAPLPESALDRRLREADSEELLRLVREHLAELEPPAVRQVLHNPFCTAEIAEILADQPRLVSFYEVRRDLALHPRAPEPLALRFVPGLWWRDLMALSLDTRLRPRVRRAADQALFVRLPQLALGERINLARRAAPGVLAQLRHDPHPSVIAALLDNPRLTEDILGPVVHAAATPGPVLAAIAADRRWSTRPGLQVALARNPNTPPMVALRLLPLLRKPELRMVAHGVRVPEAVRLRARVLLGEIPEG
jgi:hypothetical protein